jgi:molybdate transport system substrate-binding protein
MGEALTGISSMATKHVLAELAKTYAEKTAIGVCVESMGGVDAAARVRGGQTYDFVSLASDALAKLEAEGHVVPGTRRDIARSGIAIAVAKDARAPDISTEEAVRDAVAKAKSIGFSTGPSGAHLAFLFEKWGIADAIRKRLKQAAPGVGVGALVANGDVDLGFQQMSELIHVEGIRLVGALPKDIQSMTTFSAGVCATSAHRERARALLQFLSSSVTDGCKLRHGMQPCG